MCRELSAGGKGKDKRKRELGRRKGKGKAKGCTSESLKRGGGKKGERRLPASLFFRKLKT